ncbi:hypothetical protein MTR_7g072500 [Medicago truncatula]|uniref:Uncharacterized protein n=1 Tax=Medicago truncatula TaxID=3880 RepID=G7KX24_MEDTR|nr:hypothetical protein MTR_7g072500 [Medicago truncatula]
MINSSCLKEERSRPSGYGEIDHCNTKGRRGREVVVGAQGTTMSGSRQLLEEPNHIGMRGILRLCRYGTTWLKEGL